VSFVVTLSAVERSLIISLLYALGYLLYFSFLPFTIANAQQWIDSGATWYYGYEGFGEVGFYKVIYEADTVIDDHVCQQLGTYEHVYYYNPRIIISEGLIHLVSFSLILQEILFFFQTNILILVSMFSITSIHKQEIHGGVGFPDSDLPCSSSNEIVDSTGVMSINSQSLRWIAIHNNNYNRFGMSGKIIDV